LLLPAAEVDAVEVQAGEGHVGVVAFGRRVVEGLGHDLFPLLLYYRRSVFDWVETLDGPLWSEVLVAGAPLVAYAFPVKGSERPPTPKGRTNLHRQDRDVTSSSKTRRRAVLDRLTEWPIRKPPAWGITERASERLGNAREASNRRKFDSRLSSRKCPRRRGGPADLDTCRAAGTRRDSQPANRGTSKIFEGGRKLARRLALRVDDSRKAPIESTTREEEVHTGHVGKNVDQRSSHGGLVEENTPRADAAVAGARRLRMPRRRLEGPTRLPPGAGREERTGQAAGASGVCLPQRGRLRSAHYNGVQRPTRPVPGALAKKTHAARGRSTSRQQISNMKHSKFGSS
ncbi:hypothetical protein THAOC_06434, partial [Thalassiosira oceanica]